jgi:hypothetical protein
MGTYKKINLALLLLSLLIVAGIFIYWELICKAGGCSNSLMVVYLSPLTQVGLFLCAILAVLLFLPSHYFEKWLKWMFLWLFPLYLVSIYQLGDSSSNFLSFSYALAAQLFGYVFAGLSLVFVLSHFVYKRFIKKTS